MISAQYKYLAQVGLIYIVVIACIINLALQIPEKTVWISLLSSCVGYILPSPSIIEPETKPKPIFPLRRFEGVDEVD
jgi:hypothetical protein